MTNRSAGCNPVGPLFGGNAMSDPTCIARFSTGLIVITRGALDVLHSGDVLSALGRHIRGDWGNVRDEDRQHNDEALTSGLRLLSSYLSHDGTKFWIITEHDRSLTTVLLPEEY